MSICVCTGAVLQCSFGLAPSTLAVLPINRTMIGGLPVATIMDSAPFVNILPFGMCHSPANPMVIAATAAALGVPTPMPCVPMPAGAWLVGVPNVLLGNKPILNYTSKLMCTWGGIIQIVFPGQATTMLP